MLKSIALVLLPITIAFTTYQLTDCHISKEHALARVSVLVSDYLKEIVIGLIGFLVVLKVIRILKQAKKKPEVNFEKCTTRIPREHYESFKKKYTEDTIREYMESFEFKRYVDVKRNNRLREIELTDSDNIVLSDDSSVLGEDEKEVQRQ
jgi:hypothetical protein